MKLFSFTALMMLFAAIWVAVFGYVEFFILLLLSVLPINLMYGSRQLAEIHQDQNIYKGRRLLIYPPVIFGVLVLTHSFFMEKWVQIFG